MWHTHLMWALTFSENNLNQMYPHKAASHSQRDRRESARRDLQSFASFCLPTFRHFLESAPRVGTGNKSSLSTERCFNRTTALPPWSFVHRRTGRATRLSRDCFCIKTKTKKNNHAAVPASHFLSLSLSISLSHLASLCFHCPGVHS